MKLLRERKLSPGLQLTLKLLLTGIALYIVFHKIDIKETWNWFQTVSIWALFTGLLLYNISQVISSKRLAIFFEATGITVGFFQNLKLYYKGMFYNLFLPGGIGGDGYKIFQLHSKQKVPFAKSALSLLADRSNGAIALLVLLFVAAPASLQFSNYSLSAISLLSAIGVPTVSYTVVKRYFSTLQPVWNKALVYSAGVQLLQLLEGAIILLALNIPLAELPEYCVVFLISSLFSAIPFTIGGIGAREFVFVIAADYTVVNSEKAVAFSLLFFLINGISSIPGGLIKAEINSNRNS